ncbi:MAG: hypothetical protein CM1200mP35_05900 [Chloroflexota bacterium]|nr:MAG: hypothetical protein CM1200mP35_05900 [Chloroflexota bacterium]
MALDPDVAGQQATLRSLETSWDVFQKTAVTSRNKARNENPLLFNRQEDLELKIASLPDGLDPDELIRRSSEEWTSLLTNAKPLFEYLLPALANQLDVSTPQGKSRVVEILFPFIASISDPLQQDLYFQHLAKYLDIPEHTLKSNIHNFTGHNLRPSSTTYKGYQTSSQPARAHVDTPSNVEKDPIEEYCLALAVQFPETIPNSGLAPEYFFLSGNRALADRLIQFSDDNLSPMPVKNSA